MEKRGCVRPLGPEFWCVKGEVGGHGPQQEAKRRRADQTFGHLGTELRVLMFAVSAWLVGPAPPQDDHFLLGPCSRKFSFFFSEVPGC